MAVVETGVMDEENMVGTHMVVVEPEEARMGVIAAVVMEVVVHMGGASLADVMIQEEEEEEEISKEGNNVTLIDPDSQENTLFAESFPAPEIAEALMVEIAEISTMLVVIEVVLTLRGLVVLPMGVEEAITSKTLAKADSGRTLRTRVPLPAFAMPYNINH